MYKMKLGSGPYSTILHRRFNSAQEALDYAAKWYLNMECKPFKCRAQRPLASVRTDAGRITGEISDCAVRALVVTTPLTYQEAHQLMKDNGRQDRRGTPMYIIHKSLTGLKDKGITATMVYNSVRDTRMTLGQFIDQHPTGNYYVVLATHALGVINGIIHDTFASGRRKRIQYIFKMEAI